MLSLDWSESGAPYTGLQRLVVTVGMLLVGAMSSIVDAESFQTGDRIVLETLGTIPGPRWLDGRTHNGTVGLAPTFGAPFTGTRWELTKLGANTFALKSLGHVPGNPWLDGRTGDGTVGLAPATTGIYTGTRWEILEVDRDVYTLRTLGTIDGPRWLDGRTHDGTVGLSTNIGGVFTGTRWRIHRDLPSDVLTQHNDNGRTGASLAETVLEPPLLRAGRFGKLFQRDIDGAVFGQPLYADGLAMPGKGVHNVVFVGTTLNYVYAFDADDPAQSAPLWRSPQLGTPVHRANVTEWKLIDPAIGITSTPVIDRTSNTMYVVAKSKSVAAITSLQDLRWGDRILLECLGTIPGPPWLNGRTVENDVVLADRTTFPFTGTVWEVGREGADRITLRSLGHLVTGTRYLDGRTQDGTVGMAPVTTGGFTGTHWQVVDAGGGTFNLRNLGTIQTQFKWLDGRTGNGSVGLAPATTGIYTGTRWRIHRLDFHNRLYAIDITTGQIKRSAEIAGAHAGMAFDPKQHLNRPGLLLQDNVLYVGFGAHADTPPWYGWVFAYEANGLGLDGVYATTHAPNYGGGLWQAGNGLVGDAHGFVYFTTGNGDPNGPPPPQDTRNSFVKLQLRGNVRLGGKSLDLIGAFPPVHRRELDICDIDLGSSGPVMLPGTRRLVGAGKEGVLYLLDMDGMNELQHFQATQKRYANAPPPPSCPNDGGLHFDVMYYYPHVHGSPVVWPLDTDVSLVYLWAEQDSLRSFVYDGARGRVDVAALSAEIAPQNSMPGGVLTLSANGRTPGTGIVWATKPADCADHNSVGGMSERSCNGENKFVQGILHAFDATTLYEVWRSDRAPRDRLGFLAKFSPPTVAHGKVYVATSGDPAGCTDLSCPSYLLVYGLLWGQ